VKRVFALGVPASRVQPAQTMPRRDVGYGHQAVA